MFYALKKRMIFETKMVGGFEEISPLSHKHDGKKIEKISLVAKEQKPNQHAGAGIGGGKEEGMPFRALGPASVEIPMGEQVE